MCSNAAVISRPLPTLRHKWRWGRVAKHPTSPSQVSDHRREAESSSDVVTRTTFRHFGQTCTSVCHSSGNIVATFIKYPTEPQSTQRHAFDSTSTSQAPSDPGPGSYLPSHSHDAALHHAKVQSPPDLSRSPSPLPPTAPMTETPAGVGVGHRISLKGTMAILPTSHSRYTLRGRTSSTRRSQRAGKETRKGLSSLYVVRP